MAQLTIDQALRMALAHRQAGRTSQFDGLYRQLVSQMASRAEELHWLGLLACEAGHIDIAIDLIGRAIAAAPRIAVFHANLGECYRRAGQREQAIASLDRAVALGPDLAQAHHNLGVALRDAGQIEQSLAAYRRVIEITPHSAEAHATLAATLFEAGRTSESLAASTRAIALNPDLAAAHTNAGNALARLGRLEEAVAAYGRAIALKPDQPETHVNLGNSLRELGRYEASIAAYERAIQLRPGMAEAYSNLGNALRDNHRPDQAAEAYRRAIALKPDYSEAYSNLGIILREQGKLDEAIAASRQAIALKPGYAEAHSNLGNVWKERGNLDEAIASYRQAIALKPDFAEAQSNLGVTLKERGWLDEAVAALERSIALDPSRAAVYNNYSSTLLAQGDHAGALRACQHSLSLRPHYSEAHSNLLMCSQYRTGLTLAELARLHSEWDERYAAPLGARDKEWDLDRNPDRPLRVGFVSPDLRYHPVGIFLARVLENFDAGRCATVCYHTLAARDGLTRRLEAAAQEWHAVAGLDDEALAARIRNDRIDILFDLAGHTADGRLLVFARRPAPIQISWIGYVGTTGLQAMDYLLADRYHVPPGAEVHYCEKILRMPDGYVCYTPPADTPAVGPLPAFERGHVTFGCFNNVAKLTSEVIALWAEIVGRVPGSRLLLISPALGGPTARRRIAAAFEEAGGAPGRLELRGSLPWHDLMAAYNTVDLALDPFPYSGGLTTCEALWMGVPVVTCPGETFASRHSFSHLSNVGLTETIAAGHGDYADLAVRLAGDLPHLSEIRAGLREKMARSPLCDGARFAENLTSVLRGVWRRWCEANP